MTVPTAAAPALLLAAVVLCSSSSATCDEVRDGVRRPVPAMYVFGDSLVDAGNNDFLSPPAPRARPPNGVDLPSLVRHRTGRFTNGFNLADIIAQQLGFEFSPPAYLSVTTPLSDLDLLRGRVGANYASGGSGILDITGNGSITLREQVQLFAETKARMIRAGLAGRESLDYLLAQSLFVISAGGNDFDAFDYGLPMSEAPAFIAAMVDTYINHINDCAAEVACCGGGKFNGEVGCSFATSLCADRDEYLFWDAVHGTEAAYRRAVHAFFYGTARDAEPVNLAQLVPTVVAVYSSSI
ncbi:hypothetical protein PR202_gb23976 [Eleusine coracana subsp. coracana]|uniref:GDSL esterase/lipase n=1 Tax=Eleusine coracana subsp. coracana TaxID=191504 RepID=A0AAV5FKC0_ELECO|nr:hypothetical protein PR202_gb23976 [Eleusine coracana subsp. coracana]